VLRWAGTAGVAAVTWWVPDWTQRREWYERQGFDSVGRWRPGRAGEEWQLRVTIRPDPRFWQDELLGVLGDVSPRRPGWPYVLRSLGAMLAAGIGALAVVALVVVFGQPVHLRDWVGLGTVSSGAVVLAATLAAVSYPFIRIGVHASALSQARTAAALLRKDRRAPVLYLRSFPDDRATRRPARLGSLVTEEQAVAAVVADVGPFVGLGRAVRVVGAARGEVVNPDWRPAVAWLLAHARFVVLRCGTGPSLIWELAQAVKLLRPAQLLLIVPEDAQLYRDFCRLTATILPRPLPPLRIRRHARHRLAAVVHFGPGWQPSVVSLNEPRVLRSFLALDTVLALRLGAVLRGLGVRRFRFWTRRLWVLVFLAVQVFFIIRIALDLAALTRLR
jgi:hypothetical protein